jgi:hypothetical protein
MTKTTIAKVLIITLMIFAKENLIAQWSGTNPEFTNGNVGIGEANPSSRLEINRSECNYIQSGFNFWSMVPFTYSPQLRLSYTSCTPNSFGQFGQFLPFSLNTTKTHYWDVVTGDYGNSNLEFKLFKNNNLINTFLNITENFTEINNQLNVNSSFYLNGDGFILGKLQIGDKKATFHPDAKLHVTGKVAAQHFVVTKPTNWSDKVFDKNYKLLSLPEIEAFIANNKHLPEIPSEKEVMEKGYDTNEMDALLLQKIEELTLHMIELKKENEALKKDISNLKNK